MTQKIVIFFPLLAWDSELLHRDQMLAREFAKSGVEAFFIDRVTRKPWKIFGGTATSKQSGVNVVSVFTLPYFQGRLPFIYKINNYLIGEQLKPFSKKLASSSTFFVSNPDWVQVVTDLRTDNSTIIYDVSDDFVALAKNDKWRSLVTENEKNLVKVADKYVITTPSLQGKVDAKKPSIIVSNGVDLTGFGEAKPTIARDGYRKVVGFIGGIYEWVDLELIKTSADAYPEALFVLIGPTNRLKEVSRLCRARNVQYLGAISKKEIANYFASLDVGLMPFVSEKDYPRLKTVDSGKLYQYLYFGYPVVSTDFEQVRSMGDEVLVAKDTKDFIEKLGVALQQGRKPRAKNFASENSWESKSAEIIKFI